jgi:hypothetical protein
LARGAPLLAASLGFGFYRAWQRRQRSVFAVAFAGAAVMVSARLADGPREVVWAGFVTLVAGMFGLNLRANTHTPTPRQHVGEPPHGEVADGPSGCCEHRSR